MKLVFFKKNSFYCLLILEIYRLLNSLLADDTGQPNTDLRIRIASMSIFFSLLRLII